MRFGTYQTGGQPIGQPAHDGSPDRVGVLDGERVQEAPAAPGAFAHDLGPSLAERPA